MDLAGWRDIALIIIGILNILITLIVGTIFFGLWYGSRKGFGALERLIKEQVRPRLDTFEKQLAQVRERTAALPGNRPVGGRAVRAPKKRSLLAVLPFRRRRRRIPFLPG